MLVAVSAADASVTVFLERNGRVVSDDVTIPRFGGGDRAWNGIVSCVKEHFAPFEIEVVENKPARGQFITAIVGGRASQLGLDDRWTNGVGPHNGKVIPNALVFIFSKVGTGEKDVSNLCAVTAHEVAHSLGLDHTYKCGDMMSYFLDRCGKRKFLDFDARCGEDKARRCADGARTQNSYQRLGELVGFRDNIEPEPEPEPQLDVDDDWPQAADPYETDEPRPADPYDDDVAPHVNRAPQHVDEDAANRAPQHVDEDSAPQGNPQHNCGGRRHGIRRNRR